MLIHVLIFCLTIYKRDTEFPWFSSINHWPNSSTSLHLANLFLIICFWSLAGNFWPASRTMLVVGVPETVAEFICSLYSFDKSSCFPLWYYIYFNSLIYIYIYIIKYWINILKIYLKELIKRKLIETKCRFNIKLIFKIENIKNKK